MVMGSSIPRPFAGPCLSVTLPAPSSIFFTSPLMEAACASVLRVRPSVRTSAAVMRLIGFIILSIGSFHRDVANHAVVAMVGNQAGKFEGAGLGELPEDLRRLARSEPHPVGIVVLHVRMLLHHLRMREILFRGGKQEFMVFLADVAQHETDLLA